MVSACCISRSLRAAYCDPAQALYSAHSSAPACAQGRHRQEALLGRLLRELEDEDSAAIADAVGRAEIGRASPAGAADPAAECLALSWRDGLIGGASLPRIPISRRCYSYPRHGNNDERQPEQRCRQAPSQWGLISRLRAEPTPPATAVVTRKLHCCASPFDKHEHRLYSGC